MRWASGETQAGSIFHLGYCLGYSRWWWSLEIDSDHSASEQSSVPEHRCSDFSHYCLVALQGSSPIPKPCDELENKWQDVLVHIREAGGDGRTVCDTAQLCLLPRLSSVLVSSFPANTNRGLLGSWGAGTRFQRHMLMYRGSLLGFCREHGWITGQQKCRYTGGELRRNIH